MKPLVCITTYVQDDHRLGITKTMLKSLEPDLHTFQLYIVDNASMPEAQDWIRAWVTDHEDVALIANDENRGCPRALNQALEYRAKGQPFVKLDNDVEILAPGWVNQLKLLIKAYPGTAMISAYYEPWPPERVRSVSGWGWKTLYQVYPVIGHAVWHTGPFMDHVGYFDVLHQDHIYGFEDLIMSFKAQLMGGDMVAWKGWQIKNLQRHNALGNEARDDHVTTMRPHYNKRLRYWNMCNGRLYTGPDGQPR
jgi:glycosyltransferase involved in cell wall biosynthesis